MTASHDTTFTWRGRETLDAIRPRLVAPTRFEIVLPVDYNHALFASLNPAADSAQTEKIDVEGDATLLETIAKLQGLEALVDLVGPLSELHAKVAVLSPPRIVIVLD